MVTKKRKMFTEGYCRCCAYDFQKGGLVGYEISEVYDGVIAWKCPNCKIYHMRFNLNIIMTKKEFDDYYNKKFRNR